MELDDMKKLWQAQHAEPATGEGLSISHPGEQDAERIAADKSAGFLTGFIRDEYKKVFFEIVVLIVLLSFIGKALVSGAAMVGYLFLLISLLAQMGTTVYKIRFLKRIDPAIDTISGFVLKMDRYRLLYLRENLIGIASIPFGIVSLYLLVDGYRLPDLMSVLPRLVISFALGMLLTYYLYRLSYRKKFKTLKEHISEIKEFQDSK